MTPEQIAKSGTEHAIQSAFFAWCALNQVKYPKLKWFHAIPNGGLRDNITASKLKAEGVKKGIPDTFLPVPVRAFYGLYIEFKKPGGKPTKEQLEFGKFVTDQGYCYFICTSWEIAAELTVAYLTLDIPKLKQYSVFHESK